MPMMIKDRKLLGGVVGKGRCCFLLALKFQEGRDDG